MDKNISLESQESKILSQNTPTTITKDRTPEGLSDIKQGDIISGTVVAVDEQVTIDFYGQQVTVSKEVLNDFVPGEVNTFEVVKVSKTTIELKLLDKDIKHIKHTQTFQAKLIPTKDWETVRNQKEQNARLAEKEQLSKELMNKFEEISASLTENDYAYLEQEGFPIETMTIRGLYQAISRVKAEQCKNGRDREVPFEKVTEKVIAARLKEENLPVTDKNISEIKRALALSDTVGRMDDKTWRYLIDRELAPTIENIYKAFYSEGRKATGQRQELTQTEWKQLLPQVKAVIQDSGYEVNDENLQDAKWLIENKLPLTDRTFAYKKELDKIKRSADTEMVLDRILMGMKKGIQPKNVSLKTQDEAALQKTLTDIHSISPEAVSYAVSEGIELTIKRLAAVQADLDAGKITPEEIKKTMRYITEAALEDVGAKKTEWASAGEVNTESISGREENAVRVSRREENSERVSGREENAVRASRREENSERVSGREADAARASRREENSERVSGREADAVRVSRREENSERVSGREENAVRASDRDESFERVSGSEKNAENILDREWSAEGLSDGELRLDNASAKDTASHERSGNEDHSNSNPNKQYEAVRAQRQMEEIRLKMTLEAASRFEKKGISIETQKLEKVVEELRKLEDSYYRKLLKEAEAPLTTEAIETLRNTSRSLEQLRYIPIRTIGATLSERGTQTIPSLLTEGLKLQSEYAKAGTAYETLMTVPNAEYGDSIRKAFSHADSLLNWMSMENTEQNQRAVRILGYNQMEITPENIEQVKAYDSEVTTLIRNLHPAVTVRMIRDGINPLNMTISDLNDKIAKMKREQGITSEEKFSIYLHKLEKEEGITPEERKAFIGIYRLLYNVEKSDGAALGSVIKAGRKVTLDNLLTAVQTWKKGRLDTVIDDEFGTLTRMTRNKESIAEQLRGFRRDTLEQDPVQELAKDEKIRIEEQTRYLERVLEQITEELSPDKMCKLAQEHSENTFANITAGYHDTPESNYDIWDRIKDISAEQLLQKLQQVPENDTVTEGMQAQKVQQLRELCEKAEQAIRFLNDFQMSATPQNITLANHILSNGPSPIIKLVRRQREVEDENLTDSIKELKDLSDTINDKSSMNEAYEALEEKARRMLENACSEETLDSRRLTELRNTAIQMSFLRTMAAREFYQIPIQTAKGITNVNLTILRGGESGGKVSVAVYSEQLGDIKAEFSLKQQMLKGFISCDNRNGLEKLQAHMAEIEKVAKENNITLKQMDFGIASRENDIYSYRNPENGQPGSRMNNRTERTLYRIAKSIVQTVRLAEDSEEGLSRAVS